MKNQLDLIYSSENEENEALKQDTLASLLPLIEDKAEYVAKYIREQELIAKVQKEEAKALTEAAKKTENRVAKLMGQVDYCMNQIGTKELQAGAYKFKYTKGREVVEVNEVEVPEEYFELKPVLKYDKNDFKKLLKEGKQITGVSLVRKPDTLSLK